MRLVSAILILLIGLGASALAVRNYQQDGAFAARAKPVSGLVLRNDTRQEHYNHHYSTHYYPVASYSVDGTTYEQQFGEYPASAFPQGTSVELLYDPAQPRHIKRNSGAALYTDVLGFASLGAVVVVVGIFLIATNSDGGPSSSAPFDPPQDEQTWRGIGN